MSQKRTKPEQPTSNEDILQAVNTFASEMEKRFNNVDKRFQNVEQDMATGFSQLRKELSHDITRAEWRVIEHLDEQAFKVKGDLLVLDKKADAKTTTLVDTLHSKKIITSTDKEKIQARGPFVRNV